jgi:hypothetical protein
LTGFADSDQWRSGVRRGNDRGGAKQRKGETQTDDAFHGDAPEQWGEYGPTVGLELRDEKTPLRIVIIEQVDQRSAHWLCCLTLRQSTPPGKEIPGHQLYQAAHSYQFC